ncbi:hypothetical protein U1Q18_038937 [Sarracenia purpurea var. burkii]
MINPEIDDASIVAGSTTNDDVGNIAATAAQVVETPVAVEETSELAGTLGEGPSSQPCFSQNATPLTLRDAPVGGRQNPILGQLDLDSYAFAVDFTSFIFDELLFIFSKLSEPQPQFCCLQAAIEV